MLDSDTFSRWVGHAVHDPAGKRIGDLIQVYLDGKGQAQWMVVKRGTMTTRTDFVPASTATIEPAGLTVSLEADVIHGSPHIRDRHHVSSTEEQALNDYYGIRFP